MRTFDLVSLSPTERDANDKPKSAFRQRIIFPVEGFANSVDVMQKALQGRQPPANLGHAAARGH
jgi:hypothetical protein